MTLIKSCILGILALAATATAAQAAARVDFAVAFADDLSGTYALNRSLSFNPTTAPITFNRIGRGDYQFVFGKANIGLLGGNVQVRGYGYNVRCTVVYWSTPPSGSDVTVRVRCRKPASNDLEDTWTVVQWYAASGTDALETAYLWASVPTPTGPGWYTPSPTYQYNSGGGTNQVSHGAGTGEYLAYLPGLVAAGGNPQVTAYGDVADYCKIDSWYHLSFGTFVGVHCFDRDGDPKDALWSLRYTNGHLADTNVYRGAYYFGDGNFAPAVPAIHRYTPASITTWHSGGLTFEVNDDSVHAEAFIPGLTIVGAPAAASPMVTAVGHDNVYCNPVGMTSLGDGTLDSRTQCFDAAGNVVGSPYTYAMWSVIAR